jgi:predicted nucleic acid-binding protein
MAFNPMYAAQTRPFWEAVQRGEITVIVSDVLNRELLKAPQRAQELIYGLPQSQTEHVVSTEESDRLAEQYIIDGVVGETSLDDYRHIALATLAHADVLVSWNFKHIVNINRIRGYNSVNMKLGYSQIEIRTPFEVIHDET